MGTRDTLDHVLLTIEEAAKFLNVSRATVYRLVKKGGLEKVKEPGKRTWLVTMSSLDAYELATNLTLPEIAARLLSLERKVDFLLTRGKSNKSDAPDLGVNFADLNREMRKRHPELFRAN